MRNSIRRAANLFAIAVPAAILVSGLALSGCGKDKKSPTAPTPPGSTTFVGTMAGANVSGMVTVTIAATVSEPQPGAARAQGLLGAGAAQGSVGVTGTLAIAGGATSSLTGTYDTVAKTLAVTGGGYNLGGTLASGVISGAFTGPSSATGGFTLSHNASGSVKVYIGTFTSTSGGDSGRFNLVSNGTVLTGLAVTTGGTQIPLNGTLTDGTAVSIVNPGNPSGPPLATGTLDTGTHVMSGQFDDGAGNSGNWTSTIAQ
jgi:hypothetical protein